MGRSPALTVAIFVAVILQNAVSFYIPSPATSTQSLQQPLPTTFARAQRRPQQQQPQSTLTNALRPSRWTVGLLAADGGDGGGEGFSAAPDKVSRKSAKKAKARGGPPVIPEAKVTEGQQVSKAVVAEVLGAQAKKDGGGISDETAARLRHLAV